MAPNKVFIGWDPREDIAYQVAKHSLLRRSNNIEVIPLKQQELRDQQQYWRQADPLSSTEFTFTRFLVPKLMNYKGWALFCDCDIIFLEDVNKLFDQADDKYAVMVAKHEYTPTATTKMDGQKQSVYPRKNWSSVMLWNCGHPANARITSSRVNDPHTTGKYLHRFEWLDDAEIGEISHEWNWLVDWYKEPVDGSPKALHYTEGGPWFENYRFCEYHDLWKKELNYTLTDPANGI
jgi:lipopolysaccharide biosynthesis glycosyltransferase